MTNNMAESVQGINVPTMATRRLRWGKGASPSVLELSSIRWASSRAAYFSSLPLDMEKWDMMLAARNNNVDDDDNSGTCCPQKNNVDRTWIRLDEERW